MKAEILRVQNLTVLRDSGCSLKNIYINLYEGEALGIIGLHNSGKSFFFDFLTGKARAKEGRIFYSEEAQDAANWQGSKEIYRIQQKSSLIEYCSVLENIFVIQGINQHRIWINWRALRKQAEICMEELEMDVSLNAMMFELSLVEHHEVELLKAYIAGAKLILIDDVTIPYHTGDFESLYRIIRRLQDKGISFIINGCQMEKLQRLTDRCLFMANERAVKVVENVRRNQIDEMKILMGSEENSRSPKQCITRHSEKIPYFEAAKVKTEGQYEWNFQIGKGEIVVFTDPFTLQGEHLTHALGGQEAYTGAFFLDGRRVKKRGKDVYIADFLEDNAVIESLALKDNLCLSSYPLISRLGFINPVKTRTIERLFLEQYTDNKHFQFKENDLTYAEKMAVYLERLKLQKWKLLVCSNLDNVMSYELEVMIKTQLRKMAEGKRSVCICAASFEKFCDLADYFLVAVKDKGICRFTYSELRRYFGIQ